MKVIRYLAAFGIIAFFGFFAILFYFGDYGPGENGFTRTVGLVSALAQGNFVWAGIFGTLMFLDYTQFREHNRPPREQSWYNPERIMDRLVGSLRLGHSTPRTAFAAS